MYGGECKDITAVEIEANSVQTLTGHQSRVKSLDFVRLVIVQLQCSYSAVTVQLQCSYSTVTVHSYSAVTVQLQGGASGWEAGK